MDPVEKMCNSITTFEIWTYRDILRIEIFYVYTRLGEQSQKGREVFCRMNNNSELLRSIQKTKLDYFGYTTNNTKYVLLEITI